MSKAWACCDYNENILEVVFAETKDKANAYFKKVKQSKEEDND